MEAPHKKMNEQKITAVTRLAKIITLKTQTNLMTKIEVKDSEGIWQT